MGGNYFLTHVEIIINLFINKLKLDEIKFFYQL